MNGVMPGPLWLAIASATRENGNLTDHSHSVTFDGRNTDRLKEITNCRTKRDGNSEAGRAGGEFAEAPRYKLLKSDTASESEDRHGVS